MHTSKKMGGYFEIFSKYRLTGLEKHVTVNNVKGKIIER